MPRSNGKIYQYDRNGNFLNEYETIEQAADLNKIASSNLNQHLKGKFSFCHNFIFTKKYYIKLPSDLLIHKSKRIYKTKQVHQYDLNGNYIKTFKSRKEAVELVGVGFRHLSDYLAGCSKGKSVCGYMWSYEKKDKLPKYEKKKNFKKIYQYSINGKYLKSYNSIIEAAKLNNLKNSCISHCARGAKNFPTYGGYIWKYEKLKKVKPVKPKKTPIKVYKNNKFIKIFESQSDLYKKLKIPRNAIWQCLTKKREFYKEYKIIYAK